MTARFDIIPDETVNVYFQRINYVAYKHYLAAKPKPVEFQFNMNFYYGYGGKRHVYEVL